MTVMLNRVISIRPPKMYNPEGLQILNRPKQTAVTILRTSQAKSLTARKKPKAPVVAKTVPSKSDIRNYCRKDKRFCELDDFISSAIKNRDHRGVSRANTVRRSLRASILKTLPFGPIL